MVFFSRLERDREQIYYGGGANVVKFNLDSNSTKFFSVNKSNITFLCQNFNGT